MPSIDTTSPSRTIKSPTLNCNNFSSTLMLSVPQTAVFPIPLATTAACEVLPPRLVKIPSAATMPTKSSGLVSLRTKITLRPVFAKSKARFELKTISPTAAPGEAAIPVAIKFRFAVKSNCGNINWAN